MTYADALEWVVRNSILFFILGVLVARRFL